MPLKLGLMVKFALLILSFSILMLGGDASAAAGDPVPALTVLAVATSIVFGALVTWDSIIRTPGTAGSLPVSAPTVMAVSQTTTPG